VESVVIDTNVIVSAFINPSGVPARVLEYLLTEDAVQICISPDVLSEYEIVLAREKFKSFPNFQYEATLFLNALGASAWQAIPSIHLHGVLTDPDDH
jgi:uncharacterized protein